MSRKHSIILIVLGLIIATLVYFEATKQPPVNWLPSYSRMDKIPYGTYVAYESLEENLGSRLNTTDGVPYEVLAYDHPARPQGTFMLTSNYVTLDGPTVDRMLEWTREGNQLIIQSGGFGKLADTLGYTVEDVIRPMAYIENATYRWVGDTGNYTPNRSTYPSYFTPERYRDTLVDAEALLLVDMARAQDNLTAFSLPQEEFDSETLDELAGSNEDRELFEDEYPAMLRVPYGDGEIIMSLFPYGMTNNYILYAQDGDKYLNTLTGLIREGNDVYWDDYDQMGSKKYKSPLYYLLSNKYLRWAYYLALIGAVLFTIFQGKRKQRAIPVIVPPENQSVAFSNTIAHTYLEEKDYDGIATIMANQWNEYVRQEYRVFDDLDDRKYVPNLIARSGRPRQLVERITTTTRNALSSPVNTTAFIDAYNAQITAFKNYGNE